MIDDHFQHAFDSIPQQIIDHLVDTAVFAVGGFPQKTRWLLFPRHSNPGSGRSQRPGRVHRRAANRFRDIFVPEDFKAATGGTTPS